MLFNTNTVMKTKTFIERYADILVESNARSKQLNTEFTFMSLDILENTIETFLQKEKEWKVSNFLNWYEQKKNRTK